MEEWLFDLTNPADGVGVILTANRTTVALNVKTHTATAIVEAHNEEWMQVARREGEAQYWLITKHIGEGYVEVHSLVMGERPLVEQWLRSLTNGVKVDLRAQPLMPRAIDVKDMEEVQRLFKEMRQHESDSQRYVGLANEARSQLKALGAPLD
jgi:hypothetical protein